jgi:HlyD family secretion protein
MNKRFIIIALVIVAVLASAYFFLGEQGTKEENIDVTTEVVRGDLQIEVTTTGELQAKNSVQIMGPDGMRAARIWQVKLEEIVPEGTVVKKGDFVALLDRAEIGEQITSEELEVEESQSEHLQIKLDTAIELRQARDKIVNQRFEVDAKRLVVEQSQFEPPATIKQAELDFDKAERALDQAINEYNLLSQKAVSRMQEATIELRDDQRRLDFLQKLMSEFEIRAPENGMVIYARDDGRKRGKGATIPGWYPLVATLPDLSQMVSKTYVNEVDISRVQTGQKVNLGLDAFPEKKLTGEVISIANVGEQRPNSDAKVFEVDVLVNESDTTLRPAMTTSNAIITNFFEEELLVPLEALHSQGDTLTYVFKISGLSTVKQQIEVGARGNDLAVALRGVEEGDEVFLSVPSNPDSKKLVLLDNTNEPLAENE